MISKLGKLPGKEGAEYYKITQFEDKRKNSKSETIYFITGEKYTETKSVKTSRKRFFSEGLAQKWYKNGQLYYTTQYEKGKKEGEAIGYYASGKLKRRENFIWENYRKENVFNEDGTPATFYPHEVVASFPGGPNMLNNFIRKTMRYPVEALRNNQQGLVVVKMLIDENGKIVSSEVLKSASPALDKEALRVVKAMPDFTPAREEGIIKAFTYTLPVHFINIRQAEQPAMPSQNYSYPNNNGTGGQNRRF